MRPAHRWFFGLFLLPLLLLSACGDSLVGPPPAGFGTFHGRLNGQIWNGYGWSVLVNDTLYLVGRRDINTEIGAAEEVRLSAYFIGNGTYQITNAIYGSVQSGTVQFSGRASGPLQLINFDGTFLAGSFSVTESATSGWRFEAGEFDLPVFRSFAEVPVFPGPALPPGPDY
jgi:hypothetical protein